MKIAIAGFGLEGRVNFSYFSRAYPDAELTIADERLISNSIPRGVPVILGKDTFESLQDFDLVVRTAGLPPRKITTNGKIWSATNEFFEKCPAKIIGVTGTKGKGTTCSLIASILRAAGKKVHLVGNIGTPALEVLEDIKPDDIVIYELSSFQLWDIKKSPNIAVVLMIEPDHLDVHASFDEYLETKSQIARWQSSEDKLIYHPTNKYSQQIAESSSGQKTRYGVLGGGGVYVEDGQFKVADHAICSVDTLHLVGVHNIENACAAISAALAVDDTIPNKAITKGLSAFEGLDHRLKFTAEKRGVKYYDDSIATTPGSAIAAIKSFDQPKVLILGGVDKGGANYGELVHEIVKETNQVRAVVLIGENSSILADLIRAQDSKVTVDVQGIAVSMAEIVQAVVGYAQSGDVVVLSPAASSFDMFENYQDRGNQFNSSVQGL